MKKKQIIIDIDEAGEMQVESAGFTGKSCISEVDELMKSIGSSSNIRKKKDYFEVAAKVVKRVKA